MSRRFRGQRAWGEFVPAVHYSWGDGTFCGTMRASINETKLTNQKGLITCKNCLKKLTKGAFVEEHFEEELFTI